MKSSTMTILKWVGLAILAILVIYFGSGLVNGVLIKLGLKKDPNAPDQVAAEKARLEAAQNDLLHQLGNTSPTAPGTTISKGKAQSMADEFYPLMNKHNVAGFGGITSADIMYIYDALQGLSEQADRVLVVAMFGTRDFSLWGGTFGAELQNFSQRISAIVDQNTKTMFNDLFNGTNITF
jgi:hypothetical protein